MAAYVHLHILAVLFGPCSAINLPGKMSRLAPNLCSIRRFHHRFGFVGLNIASPSLIVTYNQYLVFGWRVKSSVVVNVISSESSCYGRCCGHGVQHGLARDTLIVVPYGDPRCGMRSSRHLSLRYN